MLRVRLRSLLLLLATLAAPGAAQLVNTPGNIPQGAQFNDSATENVDFGDVDLDGDWDAVFADGGDGGNDQNRVWINLGGAQAGPLGVFADETAVRFPVVADDSRDIEFVDFDADGDLDIYTSNTAQLVLQSNRWWTNTGLEQGGALGSYVDETVPRWIGLGGPGSSVPSAHVLPATGALPGGFVDWSCDCDFADFDNDGDLDLFHSTYGQGFGGFTPSRIFLNDGDGFFGEFNPGGFQLLGATMPAGAPALWCEGVYQPATTDTSGIQADLATNGLDIELGDTDGDFDIDVLLGDRETLPRFFHNRREENGGTLSFRDTSHQVFPPNWAAGGGNYEQQLGDLDQDGDLDLLGINWASSAGSDRLFRNDGSAFADATTLGGSGSDDNEGDFLDYDGDGDLDIYVSNFSGGDKLYRNDDDGVGTLFFVKVQTITVIGSATTLDADAADVDGDGDCDVLAAADNGQPNYLLLNTVGLPDVHAPRVSRVEALSPAGAAKEPRAVRAHVYDNAPYYVVWYDEVELEASVDGCVLPPLAMQSSAGQIFRGELPGNLVGTVEYRVRATDEYGNAGVSAPTSYVAADVPGGTSALFGADSGPGAPAIRALSVAFGGTELLVGADGMTPGNLWFLAWHAAPLPTPVQVPGVGIANLGGGLIALESGVVAAGGSGVLALPVPVGAPAVPLFFQMFEFPGDGPDLFDSSVGLRVLVQP